MSQPDSAPAAQPAHPAELAAALAAPGRYALGWRSATLPATAPVTLNVYRPAAWQPGQRVVFVQHGILRNGDDYRDHWIDAAEQHTLLIIAPTFSDARWPGVAQYNDGNVLVPASVHQPTVAAAYNPPERWSYRVVTQLAGALREAGLLAGDQRPYLFGHSAGGQFVHRLLSALPAEAQAFAAIACGNPGWYTLPLSDRLFPEGLGDLGHSPAALAQVFAYPLLILAGEADSDPDAEHLPRNPEAMAQGPHRFARAQHYLRTAQAEAARLGLPCHWRLQPVPHIGHDGRAMSAVCAALWFGAGLPDERSLAQWAGTHHA